MIRFGYWSDDARGPLVVLSFDDPEEIARFRGRLCNELKDRSGSGNLKLDQQGTVYGFDSAVMRRSACPSVVIEADCLALELDEAKISEIDSSFSILAMGSQPSHVYVEITREIDLLISYLEYAEHQFQKVT